MRQLYRFCVFGILWFVFSMLALSLVGENLWPSGLFISAAAAWVAQGGLCGSLRLGQR
jgi:hypothetical protein